MLVNSGSMAAVTVMDGNTAEGLRTASKEAEALRSFVSQRLAAASREILSVLDRVVAGYEEEASGLRQEIHGQRRRLELLELLRPQTALREPGVKRSREEEEEEEESQNRPRRPGRPQSSQSQSSIDLRIRILEDPQTRVLSKRVLKQCPILKLRCPRGLQESDFLDLLKSTFPQLTGGRTFDLLMVTKRQRLQPLTLKTLTAEDVHRVTSSTAWAKSTVYIRLKKEEEPEAREDEGPGLQTQTSSDMLTCEEGGPQLSGPAQEDEESTSQPDADVEAEETGDEEAAPEVPSAAEGGGGRSDGDEKEEGRDQSWRPGGLKTSVSRLQSQRQTVSCSGIIQAKTEDTVTALSSKPGDTSGVHDGRSPEDHPGSGLSAESVKTDDCLVSGESLCSVLSEHVAVHSRETPYRCSVCPSTFTLKGSLEKHQKLHAVAQPHRCCTCQKVFENKEQLKAHSRTHSSRKTHLCGVCGKSLSDFRSLTRHKMTHSGERPHSCQVCGRRFKLPGTLRQHEKIHTDRERSYLCEVCCKMFLTSQQLQIHLRRHSNEKPYLCGECGKGFTTKGPLTVHMRVHTGESPYRCPDCGWCFKRKTNLDNHIAVHSGVKPFVCGICGKACARKTHLTVHMRTHNGERPYKCSLCDKAFTQSHCLKTHMKSHQAAQSPTRT